MRIVQAPGLVAITYELIHDTRIVRLESPAPRALLSPAVLRLIGRFTRNGKDAIDYRVTFVDPATWTAPWTAALDLKARPDDAGVFEYACHEGNYGMANMLSTSRLLDRTGGTRP